MPTLWFAKDGPRPKSQHGPGLPVTFDEFAEAFSGIEIRYLGKEAPQFNVGKPTQAPVRTVVELGENEGTNDQFREPGFYLLCDLLPERAQELLGKS